MRVYHGSINNVPHPIVVRGRPDTDFAKGFYVTTNLEQARRWALNRKKREGEEARAIVNVYDFDENLLDNPDYNSLSFEGPNEQWLDFVVGCRRGARHTYDMVMGAVANDQIYITINLYESGVIDAVTTIAQLRVREYFNQISFHTQRALDNLEFMESLEVFEE